MNPLLPESAQRNLVLASGSPRRKEIMGGLAFEFQVVPPAGDVEKSVTTDKPYERPLLLARRKAASVASQYPDAVVIAADTVVIHDGETLEKPEDDNEARAFMKRLSGQTHSVVTGLVVRLASKGLEFSGLEDTKVCFREVSDDEIERYVASGEGRDKAGAYAVQGLGAGLVRTVDGCYYNVVGLPVALLFELLRKL